MTTTGQPLRVLRIADVAGDHQGGLARVIAATSAGLTDRGHIVEHRFAEHMPLPGPPATRRLLVPLVIPIYVMRMALRDDAPDVVEIHEPLGAFYAVLRALGLRRWLPPMVAFSHGLEERHWAAQKDRWRRLGRRAPLKSRLLVPLTLVGQASLALRFADQVIVLSTQDRDHLVAKWGIRSARVHRIDNGVDEQLLAVGSAMRSPDESAVLLFVGSWIDRKGAPEVAQAFARLSEDQLDVRLVIAGAGRPAQEVLEAFPPAVRARVEVLPSVSRSELAGVLERADIFVLPSWFEGMPLSLLEALAAGVPVVVGATCGVLDVIRPDAPERDGGRLVRPHDAADLHSALDELVRAPAHRARLGELARRRGSEFTWDRSVDGLERIYREALTSRA